MLKRFIKMSVMLSMAIFWLVACKKDNVDPKPTTTEGISTAEFNPSITYGTMTDQDGNEYKTVTIGTQTWMAENLRATNYNDGTPIPHVTVDSEWSNLTNGAYCILHNNTDANFIATYGNLYNWHTVNTGKLAPQGWHVPTDTEWSTLITYLGGRPVAGAKLKEAGISHWRSPNNLATNESGFTGLPGASRARTGTFENSIGFGYWWSATENINSGLDWSFLRYLYYGSSDASRLDNPKLKGFSVRCVKD